MHLPYKRVLIKLSGEALSGEKGSGFDDSVIGEVVSQIKELTDAGVQVALTVGGGNFWRGRQGGNMDRTTADQIGMIATAMNALYLKDAFLRCGTEAKVMSMLKIERVCEPFVKDSAVKYLESGKVVIFACGTGNPFFSTDTGATLKAAEIDAEAIFLAKNVDGVYDSDPKKNPDAKKYDELSFDEMISKNLQAMDLSAAIMCKENGIKVVAFGLKEKDSIKRAVTGQRVGTVIK